MSRETEQRTPSSSEAVVFDDDLLRVFGKMAIAIHFHHYPRKKEIDEIQDRVFGSYRESKKRRK